MQSEAPEVGQDVWGAVLEEGGWDTEKSKVYEAGIGGWKVLWVKSHQVDDEGDNLVEPLPNEFVSEGNRDADGGADRGHKEAMRMRRPDVLVPVGGERFYVSHRGVMVTDEIGGYIRTEGRKQAWENWKERGMHGAVPRVAADLHQQSLDLRVVAAAGVPEELREVCDMQEEKKDVLYLGLWKQRMGVQGGYTHYVKVKHEAALGVDERMGRRCPVPGCGGGHGTLRHVDVSCAGAGMHGVRHKLWEWVESRLRAVHGVGWWVNESRRGAHEGGCGHPEGWTGRPGTEDTPILAHMGWLVPTNQEHVFEGRKANGRATVLEEAYDLGYRGVVPKAIAERLLTEEGKVDNELIAQISAAIGMISITLRRKYAGLLGDVLEGEPVVGGGADMDIDEENGWEEEDQAAGGQANVRLCRAKYCAERGSGTDIPGNVLNDAEIICQSCYRELLADRSAEKVARHEATVGRWIELPPRWVEVHDRIRLMLGDGVRLRVGTTGRVKGVLKHLGVRWRSDDDRQVFTGMPDAILESVCSCVEARPVEGCNSLCMGCMGLIRAAERTDRAAGSCDGGVDGGRRACSKCDRSDGHRLMCVSCGDVRHAAHASEEGVLQHGCGLVVGQMGQAVGRDWLCPGCLSRHARAWYLRRRHMRVCRPDQFGGDGEYVREYPRLGRGRGAVGAAAGTGVAGSTRDGEAHGGESRKRAETEGTRKGRPGRRKKHRQRWQQRGGGAEGADGEEGGTQGQCD